MRDVEVSVIMAVYNDAQYLGESIDSILGQTFSEFEFLIVDDCSTDESFSILEKYAAKDERVKIFRHNQNRGLPYGLNELIREAKGKYIVRMDSDDVAESNRIKREIDVFKENENVDFVFSDTSLITRNGVDLCKSWRPTSVKDIINALDFHNYIPHPTVAVKKNILVENLYNECCLRGQDTELWKRLVKKNVRFYYLQESLLKYRLNPRNVSSGFFYCNTCVANNAKKKALLNLKFVESFKGKCILLLKILIPHSFMRMHGRLMNRT